GFYAAKVILESGGAGEDVSDREVVEGIRLLAETEGLFAETAGGVTVATTRKTPMPMMTIPNESMVLAITGNGLKTVGAVSGEFSEADVIRPRLVEFEEQYLNIPAAASA
ncbi:MAG: threonine synthase, partial [Acidobacteria bacterium]|nr:threonine synthase [Acidobacteriota bacterium]